MLSVLLKSERSVLVVSLDLGDFGFSDNGDIAFQSRLRE